MEYRPGSYGCLVAALFRLIQRQTVLGVAALLTAHLDVLVALAFWSDETFWPTRLKQIRLAGFFCCKALHELQQTHLNHPQICSIYDNYTTKSSLWRSILRRLKMYDVKPTFFHP